MEGLNDAADIVQASLELAGRHKIVTGIVVYVALVAAFAPMLGRHLKRMREEQTSSLDENDDNT
jgi:hypothetical protein